MGEGTEGAYVLPLVFFGIRLGYCNLSTTLIFRGFRDPKLHAFKKNDGWQLSRRFLEIIRIKTKWESLKEDTTAN